ncbi:MAG TPA: amino acid ABC transporter substrate-binding protein [Burkholderiales bacterium]|jgi:ABC-type amino acid transport substrate-binding protein|nr:amino acid ABC transporter substrate-binding protein [Burkholderiales bacterium]
MKLLWVFLFITASAAAQTEDTPVELTGTLAKVRAAGSLTIAYREASVPFSYLSPRGEPIGYSIELCRKLAEAIGEALGRELALKWLAVTSETRIDAIVKGSADLECGSTTNNLERQRQVAFSPIIFVAGTKLLVKRGSPIRSYRNLAGKTVVVTAGTTNEKAMQEIARGFKIDFRLVTSKDHAQSYAQLEAGTADAFATDDVLLYGLLAQHKAQKQYQVVGEFLSYDPYGIMFRKGDAQLAELVKRAFHDLAEDGEIERQYKRWFLQRLPGSGTAGQSLDLPMSPQLETLIRAMAAKPE